MAKLWQKGTDGQPQEIALGAVSLAAPTVIFLPGHLTRDYTPDIVKTGLDAFETLLEKDKKPLPEIYVWSYTGGQRSRDLLKYRLFPNHAKRQDAKDFAEGLIGPLLTDESGNRRPAEDIKARLRNLTFVGHSAGTIFSEEIFNAAFKMMKKAGFPRAEARDILNNTVNISLGTVAQAVTKKKRFSTIHMAHTDDLYIRIKNYIFHPLKSLFIRHARKLKVRKTGANSLLVTAAARGKWRQRHKDVKEKNIDIVLPRFDIKRTNHGFYNYVTENTATSQIAHIVPSAIFNAVARGKGFAVTGLLEAAPAVSAPEKKIYDARLAKALKKR